MMINKKAMTTNDNHCLTEFFILNYATVTALTLYNHHTLYFYLCNGTIANVFPKGARILSNVESCGLL